jgi:hypothetical protein
MFFPVSQSYVFSFRFRGKICQFLLRSGMVSTHKANTNRNEKEKKSKAKKWPGRPGGYRSSIGDGLPVVPGGIIRRILSGPFDRPAIQA